MATEKRLIDANELIEDLEAAKANAGMDGMVASVLVRYVKRCPTVDAVEVVRCKDCKGWCAEEIAKQYGVDRYCTMTTIPTNADDFCSYGERRTNERKAD